VSSLREGNKSLKVIDLSKNRIGNEAGSEIAKAIRTHPSLQAILLCENILQDDTCNLISDSIKYNRNIFSVKI